MHLQTKQRNINMKKILLPLAAVALSLASCDTSSKDSTMTANFIEYSLVSDRTNPSAEAQVSSTGYKLLMNLTQNTAEISTTDLTINNQKYSFDTEPMPLNMGYLVQEGTSNYVDYGKFSSLTNVGQGATITNLSASFGGVSFIYNGVYVPGFETVTSSRLRLMMGYDFNDQYHVQTFWPECFYAGTTTATMDGATFSTQNTLFRVQIDFTKTPAIAKCVIYNPQFAADNTNLPKAVVVEEIPVRFTNTDYYLNGENPKTQVLNEKQKLVSPEEYSAEKEIDMTVTDFALYLTSTDLTRASISLKMAGRTINFSGSSTIQVISSQN